MSQTLGSGGGLAHNPVHHRNTPQEPGLRRLRQLLVRPWRPRGLGTAPPVLVAPFLWRPEALPGHPGFATCLALPAPAEVDDVTREERDMCARNQQGSSSRHVLGEIKVFRKLGRNKQCIFA